MRSRTSYKAGQSGNPRGRPKGMPNKATREMRAFCEQFLTSPRYLRSAKDRIEKGKAPHLEVLWHHYGFGKPRETVKHEGQAARPLIIDRVSTRDEMLEALGARDADAGDDD